MLQLRPTNLNFQDPAWLQKNTGVAKRREMELSAASYPLFLAYLRQLRKLNAVRNIFDDKQDVDQYLKDFEFAYNHNYLFYLIVTQQYRRIQDLFHLFGKDEKLASLKELIEQIKE